MKSLIVVLFALLSCAAFPALATNQLASDITGYVVDANKQPVEGALVVIRNLDTGRVIQRRTNAKGGYLALNVRSDSRFQLSVYSPDGQCSVAFPAGRVLLGHRMRRNAVLCATQGNEPTFMRAWQWAVPQGTVSKNYRPGYSLNF